MSTSASPAAKDGYHHGDLRATLLTVAMEMLESGEAFSLRAVARRAGVSPTAPYRHFQNREALESALAAEGLRGLKATLIASGPMPTSADQLANLGIAYVRFALRRPALFRLMFGHECDDANDQRVQAAADLHQLLAVVMHQVFPDHQDAAALASAGWALAHGLALLHLDGKMHASSPDEVDSHVRGAFTAVLSIQPRPTRG